MMNIFRKRRRVVIGLISVVSLLYVSCGGSDSGSNADGGTHVNSGRGSGVGTATNQHTESLSNIATTIFLQNGVPEAQAKQIVDAATRKVQPQEHATQRVAVRLLNSLSQADSDFIDLMGALISELGILNNPAQIQAIVKQLIAATLDYYSNVFKDHDSSIQAAILEKLAHALIESLNLAGADTAQVIESAVQQVVKLVRKIEADNPSMSCKHIVEFIKKIVGEIDTLIFSIPLSEDQKQNTVFFNYKCDLPSSCCEFWQCLSLLCR